MTPVNPTFHNFSCLRKGSLFPTNMSLSERAEKPLIFKKSSDSPNNCHSLKNPLWRSLALRRNVWGDPKNVSFKKKSFANAIATFYHWEMENPWGVKRISQMEKRFPWVASYKQDSVSTSWICTACRVQMSPIAHGAQTQHCEGLTLSKEERVPLRLTPVSTGLLTKEMAVIKSLKHIFCL